MKKIFLYTLIALILAGCSWPFGGNNQPSEAPTESVVPGAVAEPTITAIPVNEPKYSSWVFCSGAVVTHTTDNEGLSSTYAICTNGVASFSTNSGLTTSVVINEKGKATQIVAPSEVKCTQKGNLFDCKGTGSYTISVETVKVKSLKADKSGINCPKEIQKDICSLPKINAGTGNRVVGSWSSQTDSNQWVSLDWSLPGSAQLTWFEGKNPLATLEVQPFSCIAGLQLEWSLGKELGTYDYQMKPCK